MANSAAVAAGDTATAAQYNNLRSDVLDAATGHRHEGGTDGRLVRPAGIDPAGSASGQVVKSTGAGTAPVWGSVAGIIAAIARASASLTLTTTLADVVGAALSATPGATETWLVIATFGFQGVNSSNSGTYSFEGALLYDGVAQAGLAHYRTPAAANTTYAASITQAWIISGVTAAAHTVKLQARLTVFAPSGDASHQALIDETQITLIRI